MENLFHHSPVNRRCSELPHTKDNLTHVCVRLAFLRFLRTDQVPRSAEFKFSRNGPRQSTPNKKERMRRINCAIILSFFGQAFSISSIQESAKRRALGCVNPASWLPLATGREFTQPRDHPLAQPCKSPELLASIARGKDIN